MEAFVCFTFLVLLLDHIGQLGPLFEHELNKHAMNNKNNNFLIKNLIFQVLVF